MLCARPGKRGIVHVGTGRTCPEPRLPGTGLSWRVEQSALDNLTSWVYVKTLDRRYALESR